MELRKQQGYMKKFIDSMEFIKMKPDRSAFVRLFANSPTIYMMSDAENIYAAYIRTDSNVALSLNIPVGEYMILYIDPVSGDEFVSKKMHHEGGLFCIEIPNKSGRDVAFMVVRRSYNLR